MSRSLYPLMDGVSYGLAGAVMVFAGCIAIGAISSSDEPALSSFGPSPQAVSAVPVSIAYRGEVR